MRPVNIMLVDDAEFIRQRMTEILKPYVTKFWEVDNGFAAVNLYKTLHSKKNTPDIVFMDISMHLMNGKEASQKILEFDPHAKIVIVSTITSQEWIRDCIDIGTLDYITKPFTSEKLIEVLQTII